MRDGTDAAQIRHTSALDAEELAAVRALLDQAFDGDFDDTDWEHALGGMHVVLRDGAQVVGHGSVVQRRVLHAGRALRCGYVEAIAVHADHRRRGHGQVLMRELGRIVQGAYEVGALGATDMAVPLYAAHGWVHWRGSLTALTPNGVVATPDSIGAVMVLSTPSVALDLDGELTCDWRDGDVW